MATPKQAAYIKSLMVDAGMANARYGSMSGAAKRLPHNPTMAERSAGVDIWCDRLTPKQASEVIDALKA